MKQQSGKNQGGGGGKKKNKKKGAKQQSNQQDTQPKPIEETILGSMQDSLTKLEERFGLGNNMRDWALKTFDPGMFNALPSVTNKKHYQRLNQDETLLML